MRLSDYHEIIAVVTYVVLLALYVAAIYVCACSIASIRAKRIIVVLGIFYGTSFILAPGCYVPIILAAAAVVLSPKDMMGRPQQRFSVRRLAVLLLVAIALLLMVFLLFAPDILK